MAGNAILKTKKGVYPVMITGCEMSLGACYSFEGQIVGENIDRYIGSDLALVRIEKVIFNDPATVVIWSDGTKTVVKCQPGDTYSKETGLALCIAKKFLGNKGNFNEVFKRWIPEEVDPVEADKTLLSIAEDVETGAISYLEYNGIKVGDKVKVVDPGEHYPDYKDWIDYYITDLDDREKWARYRNWNTGAIGVVKCLAPHTYRPTEIIAYVEIGDQCSMINVRGLEKVEELSVDEMRIRLTEFCGKNCSKCPLRSPVCRCGCGTHFDKRYDMTDDEIRDAYAVVFKRK